MSQTFQTGNALPAISKQIDQARINGWAELSGDFNCLHVDPEYAAGSRFKSTIAHGPMSLAFLHELMMANFGLAWARAGRLLEVRFLAPILPGDSISLGGSVEGVQEEPGGTRLMVRLGITKADGKLAVTGLGAVPLGEAVA
ncbi:MAG: MaoC family dehydratase [Pseudomonadota bacterium]